MPIWKYPLFHNVYKYMISVYVLHRYDIDRYDIHRHVLYIHIYTQTITMEWISLL